MFIKHKRTFLAELNDTDSLLYQGGRKDKKNSIEEEKEQEPIKNQNRIQYDSTLKGNSMLSSGEQSNQPYYLPSPRNPQIMD